MRFPGPLFTSLLILAFSQVLFAQNEQQSPVISIEYLQDMDKLILVDEIGASQFAQPLGPELFIDAATYVLGPGDLVSVDIEGSVSVTMRSLAVNPQGDIILPGIGTIGVKDLTIEEAGAVLNEFISATYSGTHINYFTLERARMFHIHVYGNIPYPGKYAVPAQTRVDQAIINALFEEGSEAVRSPGNRFMEQGPYSIRDISIQGRNADPKSADLVAYYRAGDLGSNPFVRDGDIITISRRQEEAPRISISGAVNTPMEIEFKQDDTVARMLRLAGGRIANAAEDSLIIHRRTPTGTELLSLTGGQASADGFELQPNDRIIVPFTHEPGSSYSAWVYGESVSPGNFSITEGETTALDLLEKSGGLNRQAMPHGGYLIRNKPAGRHMPQINTLDAARIQRTSDQVSQGFEYLELEDRLNQNQIFLDLENQDLLAGIMILDGDELYVPRDDRTVFIFGQVNKPGYYPFGENLSAESYIARAGGLALAAEPDRIFIIKAGTKSWYEPGETRLQSGDMIFVDRTPYEELNAKRAYENQRQGIINSRISLVLSAISTTFLVYSIIR